jgi:hypothetical protein
MLLASAVAALVAALLGQAQFRLATGLDILFGRGDLDISGDAWPFEEFLFAWFAATAVALGAAAARWLAGRFSWPIRPGLTVAAAVGALACLPLVRGRAAIMTFVGDAIWEGSRAVLVGVAVGAAAGLLTEAFPAVRQGLAAWTCWVWFVVAISVLAQGGRYPTVSPWGTLQLPYPYEAVDWVTLPILLALCVALAFRAARRGKRLAVLGAVSGPLLLSASSGALLPFTGASGDHYIPGTEFWAWLLLALLGSPAASVGRFLGRRAATAGLRASPASRAERH